MSKPFSGWDIGHVTAYTADELKFFVGKRTRKGDFAIAFRYRRGKREVCYQGGMQCLIPGAPISTEQQRAYFRTKEESK